MQIHCTALRLTPEDAAQLCRTENNGLLGRLGDRLRGGSIPVEVLSSRQFYYPYYCVRLRFRLPAAGKAGSGAMEADMAVDGVFGTVQGMEGAPLAEVREAPDAQVARIVCPEAQAAERVRGFARKLLYRRYHAYPSFEADRVAVVYKPLYAVLCRKRQKKYVQIIDGEMGSKDYLLETRYSQIPFHSAGRA